MAESTVLRPALYYPYIHVRDAAWLKATLLSVGSVRRIVPDGFALHDPDAVRPFTEACGPDGEPLLGAESPHDYEVYKEQTAIGRKIGEHEELLADLTRERAQAAYQSDQAFQIHRGKAEQLIEFLESRGLAWPCTQRTVTPEQWVCVHPLLGEAIMSQTAIALAEHKGLNAVTTDWRVHGAASTFKTKMLLEELLRTPGPQTPAGEPDQTALLAQVFMQTTFDLDQLTAADIASILKDSPPLSAFLNEISSDAAPLPKISDPAELQRRLRERAAAVRDRWDAFRKDAWWKRLGAIEDVADWKAPAVVGTLIGTSSLLMVGAGAGLAIGFAALAGARAIGAVRRADDSPFRYLSNIAKETRVLASPVRPPA